MLGELEGLAVGLLDGLTDGDAVGDLDGDNEGTSLGDALGLDDGLTVGDALGADGLALGEVDGAAVQCVLPTPLFQPAKFAGRLLHALWPECSWY